MLFTVFRVPPSSDKHTTRTPLASIVALQYHDYDSPLVSCNFIQRRYVPLTRAALPASPPHPHEEGAKYPLSPAPSISLPGALL